MREEFKRKMKVYAVDAAMAFLAFQMAAVMHGDMNVKAQTPVAEAIEMDIDRHCEKYLGIKK